MLHNYFFCSATCSRFNKKLNRIFNDTTEYEGFLRLKYVNKYMKIKLTFL